MLAITLRTAREQAGLTQQQVDEATGMHPGVCSEIENVQRRPSNEMLRRLCTLLRMDYPAVLAILDRGGNTLPC